MRELYLRRCAAACVLALGVFIISVADLPMVRYASARNDRACSVSQVLNLGPELDVLTLGSSAVRRGISPEAMVAASNGALRYVYNLGRPARNIIRSYTMLSDIISAGKIPKAVVVELDIGSIRGADNYDSSMDPLRKELSVLLPYSRTRELLAYEPERNLIYSTARLAHLYSQKLVQTIVMHLTGITREVYASIQEPPKTACMLDAFDWTFEPRERVFAKHAAGVRARIKEVGTTFDDHFELSSSAYVKTELAYLNKIRELTAQHGIKLIVVQQHRFMDLPLTPRVKAELVALVPELRFPPDDLVRWDSWTFNDDLIHLNPAGRILYSEWLTQTILGTTVGRLDVQ